MKGRTPSPPPSVSAAPASTEPKGASVVLAVLVTLLLAGASLATLVYHGIHSPEPDCVFTVRADRDWQDAKLMVEGAGGQLTQTVVIDKLGQYTIPFFLHAGKYTLHVMFEGREVYSHNFELAAKEPVEFDLLQTTATTHPSTQPDELRRI